jgi:DNA-binding transcriptional regulator YiaG
MLVVQADTTYTRTMRRAVEAVGDIERLASELGASVSEIEAWIAGHAAPPPGVFLRAIDIVARTPRQHQDAAD